MNKHGRDRGGRGDGSHRVAWIGPSFNFQDFGFKWKCLLYRNKWKWTCRCENFLCLKLTVNTHLAQHIARCLQTLANWFLIPNRFPPERWIHWWAKKSAGRRNPQQMLQPPKKTEFSVNRLVCPSTNWLFCLVSFFETWRQQIYLVPTETVYKIKSLLFLSSPSAKVNCLPWLTLNYTLTPLTPLPSPDTKNKNKNK